MGSTVAQNRLSICRRGMGISIISSKLSVGCWLRTLSVNAEDANAEAVKAEAVRLAVTWR